MGLPLWIIRLLTGPGMIGMILHMYSLIRLRVGGLQLGLWVAVWQDTLPARVQRYLLLPVVLLFVVCNGPLAHRGYSYLLPTLLGLNTLRKNMENKRPSREPEATSPG